MQIFVVSKLKESGYALISWKSSSEDTPHLQVSLKDHLSYCLQISAEIFQIPKSFYKIE